MATKPTPKDAALEILRIIVTDYNVRADDMFLPQWFLTVFGKGSWRMDDLKAGLKYAQDQKWITKDSKLTAAGFAAAP